jgi:hypothetical protein
LFDGQYPLLDSVLDGSGQLDKPDELLRVFEFLWYSAICYYEVFDLVLGPLSAYKNIVTGDEKLCEFVGDFVEDLRPLRDRTEKLINNFYQKIPDPKVSQRQRTLPIKSSEPNVYGKMILGFRLGNPANELREALSHYFENGQLNTDWFKQERTEQAPLNSD